MSKKDIREGGSLLKSTLKTVSVTTGIFFASTSLVSAAQPKHLMAPPQDMEKQRLASPEQNGVFSHSTMIKVKLSSSEQNQSTLSRKNSSTKSSFKQNIFFDGSSDSPMVLLGPDTGNWSLNVKDANGAFVYKDSEAARLSSKNKKISLGNQSFQGRQFILQSPAVGEWQVSVEEAVKSKSKPQEAFLLFKGDPNFKLYSYRDNNFTTQNSQVRLVAYLVNNQTENSDSADSDSADLTLHRKSLLSKSSVLSSVDKAFVEVTLPGGSSKKIKLNDRGVNGDKFAGDGKYSAWLPTNEIGTYSTQVYVEGVRPDGIRYSRTSADLYPVEEVSHRLAAKTATMVSASENLSNIIIPVSTNFNSKNVFVSGEIYASDPSGKMQSAAWIGGLTNVESSVGASALSLQFDTRWLSRQKLVAPIEIRNLKFQHATSHVPLVEYQKVRLESDRKLSAQLFTNALNTQKQAVSKNSIEDIVPAMLSANRPSNFENIVNSRATSNPKLMLVHGYCSGDVWNSSEFSNAVEFQDFKKNRTHDEFANLILNFGNSYSSYGIVAHSQGGAAALHLYSRYWSGLDNASGGRLIQSVGTPYQGTSLAGNLALIGDIFGAGCGKNTDLTYSGASNWLSTIPSWARSQVDYYTTSFKTRWWAYDYCHLATDLFLDDPEDGTTEKWSGQLSGAVNKGHKKGWCHTGGMRDPAQYRDGSRNSSMNSRAAR